MTNPLAAPTTLSESDIEGDLVHEVRREDATGSVEVTWVGTSTLIGDTVVGGRRLCLVTTEADVTIELMANVSGMEVTQSMSGPETGFYLWDPRRRALVQEEIDRDLEGTVKVPVVPSPMNLTAKQRETMKVVH